MSFVFILDVGLAHRFLCVGKLSFAYELTCRSQSNV